MLPQVIETNEQLQQLIEEISLNTFSKPFRHEARFNSRLRTTGGRYLLACHSIEINPKAYEVNGFDELVGIIKHELCHYHLHLEGKGYQHRDVDFRELLKKTNSPRYCQMIAPKKQLRTLIYFCEDCGIKYERKRRINTRKYRCGKCFGQLKLKK